MSAVPDFRAASKALEMLVEWIDHARELSAQGEALKAYDMLQGVAVLSCWSPIHAGIRRAADDLARVAEGEVTLIDSGGKLHYFVSSHHLGAYMALTLELVTTRHPLPPEGEPGREEAARETLAACSSLLSLDSSRLTAQLLRERAKVLGQAAHQPTGKSSNQPAEHSDPSPPLAPEDAAILKTLLIANPVTLTVNKIEAKVSLSDKTIRTRLRDLRNRGLVDEPARKKGNRLTPKGLALARELPEDAGTEFLQSHKPGR